MVMQPQCRCNANALCVLQDATANRGSAPGRGMPTWMVIEVSRPPVAERLSFNSMHAETAAFKTPHKNLRQTEAAPSLVMRVRLLANGAPR